MPQLDLPQPSTADTACAPSTQPTIVPTDRSVYDLFTGGWRRHLTGLPTALRGILAGGPGREARRPSGAGETGPDTAHR